MADKLEIWKHHAERLDVVLPCGCEVHFNVVGYPHVGYPHYDVWSDRCPRYGEDNNLHRQVNVSIYNNPGRWRGMAAAAYGMALRDLGGLP